MIEEVIDYCQSHQKLLEQEAAEERRIVFCFLPVKECTAKL